MCVRRRKEGEYIRTRSTISILSILRFRTLIKRLEFFSERKFHLCGDATLLLFRGGTTDFSLPRRGSRRELRGLLFIRTYVRDRANVSPLISAIFSRPMWPIVDDRDESWDFPRKRKKEKKKRTYDDFEDPSRKKETMLREKQLGERRGGKGKQSREGKVRVRIECRWRRDWLWFMARKYARIDGLADVLRFGKFHLEKIWTWLAIGQKFFEIPYPSISNHSSQNLNYHEDRQPHLSSPNWSRQRAIKLSKFIENAR